MNEQAIIDSYNLAVQNGYKKSVDDFKQLLSSNQNALNDVYNLAVQNGYRKSVDDYKVLMGVSPMAESLVASEPVVEVKKKDTVSPFVDGGSELTKFDPRTGQVVQETPAFTQPKPEIKVPEQKLPARTEFQFQPGKPLPEQITSAKPDVKQIELETNPIISFGKKFWETLSTQIPSSMSAKAAPTQNQFVERDMRLLKSIANVPDDELIEMPSLTDPRGGNTSTYKAGEYKKQLAEKIGKGNKATQASIELALKLNKDLSNSDVVSSLTQVNDGYDLLNFIGSSIGQTVAQVPLAIASGGGMSYAMESGNIYLETVKEIAEKEGITPLQVIQQGKDQVALAEIGGAVSGALDLFGAKKILDTFGLDNLKKDIRKKALTILINSQVEGATEVGQEFISTGARGLGVDGELKAPTLTQALDSYAAGMFGAAGIQSVTLLGGSEKESADPIVQPVILKYGTSKYGFIRDESGNMEMTKDLDTEEQAVSMSNMLSKAYKGLQFRVEEVQSADPYTPTKYKIVANEIGTKQTEQDAIQEQAAGQVPVQPGAGVSQEVAQGEPQAEPQGVTKENIKEKITEVNNKSAELQRKQQLELEELNRRENKNYADAFDILNVNEYSQDQTQRSQDAIDLANRHEKEFNDLLQEKRNVESKAEKINFSTYNLTDTDKLDRLRGSINSVYQNNRSALDEGFEASVNALEEANAVGAGDYVAHGMGKTSLANAYNDLINLFNKGINPIRGRGSLDVAPLSGGVSTGTTASGNAYMDGPFTLVANRNHSGPITNIDQIGGIIVNEGMATPEVLTSLRDLFPNLVVESTSNTKGLVEQLNSKTQVEGTPISPTVSPNNEVTPQVDFTEDEVNALSDLLDKSKSKGIDIPEVFQLETTSDNEVKKQVLVESATKLMETVSGDLSSTSKPTNAPTMEPTPIVITENTELTNKVPRFPLVDLIKKKINLVMADQLKVGDGFMGGPLFPLIDGIFGKAAWASINLDAARKIVRGAINGDYSVVFNMNPTAVDSNTAFMDTFIKKLNDAGIKENVLVELKSYVKDKKFGKKTDQIRKITEESTTIDEFSERLSELDVDTISDFVKKIIPSKSVVAETPIGKILQAQNITQEDIRGEISEQLAKDLPMGAMTMVLKITDANGNPVTEKNIDDAIITPEQQKAEGIPSHRNYPFYVRGTAVGILDSTVPFWNMSKAAMSTINAKVAKVIRNNEGKAYSASQARAAAMRSASMKASKAFTTQAPTKSTYQQFIERLSKAIPSVEVVTSQKEFDNLLTNLNAKSLATKNQKIYGAVLDGKLYLNPSLENFNTPIHEFAHVWTNTIKELSPEIYQKGMDLIKGSEYVAQIEGSKDYKRITDKMKKDGATEQEIRDYILEEALATAIGDKGESFATAAQQRNFKNWLNDLFAFIKKVTGISKLTPEQIQNISLDDFLNSVVIDLLSENQLFKNAEVKNLNNQLQLMAKADLNADDIVKIGLANGFSTGSIRELLNRRGFTEQAINEALTKDTPAAKRVEITEELAPGYDRMITELEGVVEKSLNRGTTQARAMENAINYLQGTKVYENATDVQREQMVRDVRKRFKNREKRAPTAEKVVGKPKKKEVTVDEMAALKDQIKLEARAAREAKGDLNTKRKALADKVSALKGRGTVTVNQVDTIVKRIEKTNLDNPIMVDRLLEYIEKVFDNANYAADMDDLRKLQKQAKSRKHTSMKNLVDRFTSINPELIPLDIIQDYKKALDFLNNRTPFYGNMNEMLAKIESYKEVDQFDAVKTNDDLIDKYKSIMSNKIKTVEDYVALIKDINTFKRKAYQLFQNEAITQEEYDDLIDGAGQDQAKIEEKFAAQIAQIKKNLISDIKSKRPKINDEFTLEENNLIRRYLEINDADLKSLSPENLYILNDLLDNINNGEIDVYRFSDIVSLAFTNDGTNLTTKQVNSSKFNMSSEKGRQELSEQESAFWEGLLGMGRAKTGALQKFIISPFNRAIASFENFIRKGYNEFLTLKKKYKINNNEMHKIGMLTTYLQEYMAQFDSDNKGVKDIGKRDWFKEILNSKAMRDNYSSGKASILKIVGLGSSEIDIIQKIWDSFPKDNNGNINPKAVYDSYMANDEKFFTKNEKEFFDAVMAYKASTITSKQKAANEFSGKSFKEVPFHMLRVRLNSGKDQIQPSATGESGNVRIKAGTGKERVSEKVGAVMTNFEKLFISGIEQTGRDYFLSGALKDINNTLSGVKKMVGEDKIPLLNTISYALSDALKFEFDRVKTNVIFKNLLSARAAMTLLNPIRTGVELAATLISYPLRAKSLSGYKSLFGEQGAMRKLLEFTESPMLLRENISKAIDINDGSIEPQSRLTKATNYLSGLPERTMMVTSWMPSFKSEFKDITGVDFDINKFNNSEAYREKYGKVIRESSAVADAQTEKIIGPTTKAGQRREVRIAPRFLANLVGAEGTVSKNTAEGQILGFFSNYPFRESTEFINGFREAAEVLNDEGALSSLSQLQKPIGIALNVAAYGFLSSVTYALGLMLLGNDDDEKRGDDLLKDLITGEGFLNELASNAISLVGSKYAAGGKAMLQLAATILIESTDNEDQKAKIKKLLKDSVFIDPLPVDKAVGFKGEQELAGAIGKYIPQFIVAYARFADFIETKNEFKVIYDKAEKNGVKSLTEDEGLKVLALNTVFNVAQLILNLRGTSIPAYNNIKTYMKGLKEEAGVADAYKGEAPANKKSSSGGGSRGGGSKTINKTDIKRYFKEEYNDLYGKDSPGYEIQQEIKAFEKEQRELKKRIKDQVYGGKD